MLWLLGYDVIMIGMSWLTSWLCFELVSWTSYGLFQSCLFNFCAVLFVVLVFKAWRFPILRKVCYYIYSGGHLWMKDPVPDARQLKILKGGEEQVRHEYCLRCHRTRMSFSLDEKKRRYIADAEDREMTREY